MCFIRKVPLNVVNHNRVTTTATKIVEIVGTDCQALNQVAIRGKALVTSIGMTVGFSSARVDPKTSLMDSFKPLPQLRKKYHLVKAPCS